MHDRNHERSASLMNVHQPQQQSQPLQTMSHPLLTPSQSSSTSNSQHNSSIDQQQHKVNEFIRASALNMEAMDSATAIATNKDLLALHNGAWGSQPQNIVPSQHTAQQQQQLPQQQLPQQQQLNQSTESREPIATVGQEKIIRAFGELMRNMARMKTFIRPSMCKPYGKQSESLQKSKFIR